MKSLRDYKGRIIRLTDERLNHILEHPEMRSMGPAIEKALANPEAVFQSVSDPKAHLYYRFYYGTKVGDKYLCVVSKVTQQDAFVLTAYLTDSIKKGERIWPKKS